MKKRLPQKATAWAILAGMSYVLCFPRFDMPAFSLLFFPSLLACLRELRSSRQAIKLGLLLSSIVAWGGFHWIVYVAQNFGGMPLPAAMGLLLLFCLVAAPQMLAFLWVGERLRFGIERLPLPLRPLFWASLYVSLEYLAHFVKIFPENLGNTLVAFPSIAQAAAIGGAPLLTFLPLFLGAALFYLRKHGRVAWPAAAAAAVLLLVAQLWGARERAVLASAPTETLRVGLIQHNMDEAEKAFAQTSAREVIRTVVGRLLEKTEEMVAGPRKPDLILWPETAYPMSFPLEDNPLRRSSFAHGYANFIRRSVRELGVPLLLGTYLTELGYDYNAGLLLGPDGSVTDAYRKQVLLIFGEYIPFSRWFPSLKQLNPMMGDFGRGPGPVPLLLPWKTGMLPLGVNICYEAILPEYMRGYVTAGARLLVNLTKDSWFGDTFEPWQHFQLSRLRSIEHRVPMIRATNTGLSGLVSPAGDVTVLSPPFQEAYRVLDVPLPLAPSTTLYTLWGEWFAQLSLLLAIGLGSAAALAARKDGARMI